MIDFCGLPLALLFFFGGLVTQKRDLFWAEFTKHAHGNGGETRDEASAFGDGGKVDGG